MVAYKKQKSVPLTSEEIEEKYKDVQDEMQVVLDWKKEEEDKLKKDNFKTPQAKSACIRNLKKVARRINSVKGMLLYWDLRKKGKSHFYASIELNEYWASLKKDPNEKEDLE